MNLRWRLLATVGILAALMFGPWILAAGLVWVEAGAEQRGTLVALFGHHLPLVLTLGLVALGLGVAWVTKLFARYPAGLLRMTDTLRLMLSVHRETRLEEDGPSEMRLLAHAANTLAQQRDDLVADVDAQIEAAQAALEEERSRLAAVISELALAVIVCNGEGRILLYNQRARLQFHDLSAGPSSSSGGVLIGLGRSIFSLLERRQIEHGLEVVRQRQALGRPPLAAFVTATAAGQLLRVQLVPVVSATAALAAGTPPSGYVLTIENMTRTLEQEAERDRLLHALTEGTRGSLGSMRMAANNLLAYPDMDPAERQRFVQIVAAEGEGMSQRLEEILRDSADALRSRWPLEDMLASDLVEAVSGRIARQLRLPVKMEALAEGSADALWARVDSYSLVFALCFLAERLQEHYAIRELRFRLQSEAALVYLDLIWSDSNISAETIYTWELESMNVGSERTNTTLRDVLSRHNAEIWYQRDKAAHRAYFRLVLPLVRPEAETGATPSAPTDGRPEYYDFDLFAQRDVGVDATQKLSGLQYTVFDTETTGLDPSGGDEIVQIGAVRIVNQRLLRQETFDQLVYPARPVSAASFAIHGISDAMLRGQPDIAAVLPGFYAFCEETVLVAHNAAFDLRFLQLKEEATGLSFRQPVLDTLLLSLLVHPNQESHSLEAIAERLGVSIASRHGAPSDALATGEIFLKLIPLLEAMEIVTLGEALAASQKTQYARLRY